MIAVHELIPPPHLPAETAAALRTVVLLYVGPDQMLPLTSALGAIVGVLLMFWQRFVALARRAWRFTMSKLQRSTPNS